MKRFIALMIIAVVSFTVIAEEAERTALNSERSILVLNVGIVSNGDDNHGYGVFIKSVSFTGLSLLNQQISKGEIYEPNINSIFIIIISILCNNFYNPGNIRMYQHKPEY